jgi:hypothetical protein
MNKLSVVHFALTNIIIGLNIEQFIYHPEYFISEESLLDVDFKIYFIITLSIMIYYVLNYRMEYKKRTHKRNILDFGLCIGFMGIISLLFVPFASILIFLLPLNLAIIIIGFLYIWNPAWLFLSAAKVGQIMFIDADSGLNILHIGAKEFTSENLFGSFLLQQEITGSKVFPQELQLGDKTILIEQARIGTRNLLGLLIADKSILTFRQSLKNAMNRFISGYGEKFRTNPNDINEFKPFLNDLNHIFSYTLRSSKIMKTDAISDNILISMNIVHQFWFILIAGIMTMFVSAIIYFVGIANQNSSEIFYYLYSNTIINTWAIAAASYSFKSMNHIESVFKKKWIWIALGLGLWAISSIIYAIYQILLDIEIPYPSIADIFWILGYFPLIIGSLLFIRFFNTRFSQKQLIGLIFFTVMLYTLIFIIVIFPIAISPINRDNSIIQKTVSIIYPILDLMLIPLIIGVYLKTKNSEKNVIWFFVSIGLLFVVVLDVIYSYLDWFGMLGVWNLVDLIELMGNVFLTLGAAYLYINSTQISKKTKK